MMEGKHQELINKTLFFSSYMLSKMFKSASLAAVFSAIVYLMTFMPIVIILSLESIIGITLKFFVVSNSYN